MELALEFSRWKKIRDKGETGERGLGGDQGIHGERGPQGIAGQRGEQGPEGPQGPLGPTGFIGPTGKDGREGQDGSKGEQGDQGPMPKHQSRGDAIRFEIDEGIWGNWINLATGNIGHAGGGGISEAGVQKIIEENNLAYNTMIDTVTTFKYIGQSKPGSNTSEPKWRIKRIDLTDTTGDIPILFVTDKFNQIWDDRLTLTYSVTGL